MPKIPQNTEEFGIRTGSTGPTAQPNDFGPSTGALGQGLLHMSEGLSKMGLAVQHVDERRRERDENRWLGESYEQEKATLNEWLANPENHSKESFARDFKEFADARIAEYDGVAPSADARDAFRSNMGAFVGRKYEEAIHTAEKTKLQNTIISIDDQTTNALMGYRNAQGAPGSDATKDLLESFGQIRLGIHSQFYEQAPTIAGKLQDKLTSDLVLATADEDPALAKKILSMSPDLDQHTRTTLEKHIAQQEKVTDLVARDSFDRFRQDRLVAVEMGKSGDKIPLSLYQSFYPGDHGAVQKAHDDAQIDTSVRSRSTLEELAPQSADRQLSALGKMRSDIKTKEDLDVFKHVAKQVLDNVEVQQKNRVSWLQQNNPEVRTLSERAATAPESIRVQAITERNDAILKYQGPPPASEDPAEVAMYLDRPSNDRHLMTLDEAEEDAGKINKGSAGEAIQAISQVLAKYPDQRHQYIAFADMVTLPSGGKGLKQEYQLAFQNKDAWWIDSYVGAIANSKDIAKLNDEKRKELTDELDKQTTWKNFQRSMIGDNFSRAKEIEGYRSGITMYAESLIAGGKPIKKAIQAATDMLIGESLGFTSINNTPLAMLKERSNRSLPHRTDEEIADIGRRLSLALGDIDPREINDANFTTLRNIPDGVAKHQALRDLITSKGFYQTSNDGQAALLYMQDDNGNSFQVTDKKKRPFVIHFDELPGYTESSVMGSSYDKKRQPDKTYPLLETEGNFLGLGDLFGTKHTKTNWPTTPTFIRRATELQKPSNQLE